MSALFGLFLPLFIQVIILYALSRLVGQLILRYLGRRSYLFLTWPGVIVHELSHAVACVVTFTRIHRISLFHPQGQTLGSVEHEQTHNPLKKIIISIAPLFGVTAVMWLVVRWLWPGVYDHQITSVQAAVADFESFRGFFTFTWNYVTQYWQYVHELVSQLRLDQWQTYVGVYALIALATHAAPSREDLQHTYVGLLGLAVLFVAAIALDQWLEIPLTWQIVKVLTYPVFLLTNFLAYGIIFAFVGILPWLLIGGVLRAFGRGKPVM